MRISAAVIAKDEELVIDRCLLSLAGLDEVVVVDTGSTDRTVEIARACGATVHTDYTWADDFAEARNLALSRCTGDWVLVIDCDEFLPEGMVDQIRAFLVDVPPAVEAVTMRAVWSESSFHHSPRLFRPGLRYVGKVHEAITCSNIRSDLWFQRTSSPAHEKDPDRNLRILLAHHTDPRSLFYLAHTYQDRCEYAEAVFWYERYLKAATWRPEITDAYLSLATCLWRLGRGDEARDRCLHAVLGNPNCKEALCLMAVMSHPKERAVWQRFAAIADDSDVLFVRPCPS